ncbi:MAG: hypothetical protein ACLR94_02475 [Acutalibacteraceae bacterium]
MDKLKITEKDKKTEDRNRETMLRSVLLLVVSIITVLLRFLMIGVVISMLFSDRLDIVIKGGFTLLGVLLGILFVVF